MKAVRIIYGTEDYLMEESRHQFIQNWQSAHGADVDIHHFTKDSPVEKVIESIEGSSLFGGGGISLWTDCPFLPLKRGGRSRTKLAKEEEWFLQKLSLMDEANGMLFFTKGNIDTACVFYKKIKDLADTVKCTAITEKDIMPYVVDFLKKKGKRLTLPAERYLHDLFQTWDSIPLLYVFSELDKLAITLKEGKEGIDAADLEGLFAGTMEKNLFTFVDAFMRRDGRKAIPLAAGLFSRSDLFLKNSGFILSRLRLLRAYKELRQKRASKNQIESILTDIQKGRRATYIMYHLQKQDAYWTLAELDDLICKIFALQLHIRQGVAVTADMEPLICLFCNYKGK